MNGIAIIEGKELESIKLQLQNLQHQALLVIQILQKMLPAQYDSNVQGYISIKDACKKYKTSHTNINNKLKIYKQLKGRNLDRLRVGNHKFMNELELLEAFRMKPPLPVLAPHFKTKSTA